MLRNLVLALLGAAVSIAVLGHAISALAMSLPVTLTVASDRSTYRTGQPVVLTITLRNGTTSAASVFVHHFAHRDVRLTLMSAGKTVAPNLPFIGEVGSARDVVVPGQTFSESEPLSRWRYQLSPGTYTISAQYFYDVAGAPLNSNTITVTVTP